MFAFDRSNYLSSFGVHLALQNGNVHRFEELCRKVEDWGFDSIWVADGLTRAMPDPFPLLTLASAHTSRAKLGTCVYVIPLRHPLVTAKLSATLDNLSGGRLILGVGVGWREDESKATGTSFSKRGKVADECLQILLQAWTNGTVNFQGDFFSIANTKMELQPEQKPHPPIWVGGNGSKAVLRAARFASMWIPTDYSVEEHQAGVSLLKEACQKTKRDPNAVGMASHLLVIIDESKDEAVRLATDVAGSLHENLAELKKWAIVGDPKEVARRLEEYNSAGVSYHILNFATKVHDEKRIELFARDLLPSFS
jgi:probable F420-dependent oxidoreductase